MRLGEVAYWDGREERERESYPKERALGKSKGGGKKKKRKKE